MHQSEESELKLQEVTMFSVFTPVGAEVGRGQALGPLWDLWQVPALFRWELVTEVLGHLERFY